MVRCGVCRKFQSRECPAESPDDVAKGLFRVKPDDEPLYDDCFEPKPLVYEEGGRRYTVVCDDGVRVSASSLFYRYGSEMVVGEVIYTHTIVEEKDRCFEAIKALIVWVRHDGKMPVEVGDTIYTKPLRLTVAGRPVLVELGSSMQGALETQMSLEMVYDLKAEAKPPGFRELFMEVRKHLARFVSFPWDPRLYDLVACWVIATYFVEAFTAFPFLYAYGVSGSGKTRLMFTVVYMARHGFAVTDPSEATLYRMAEAYKPTLGVDESILGKRVWKIVRTAFYRGGRVPRVEKTVKEQFILRLYESYMPIVFASTELPSELGGSEADESRAIFIQMETAEDPAGRHPDPWDFTDIRDKLYMARLLRFPEVIEAYGSMTSEALWLRGHEREVWLPIFTVARLVGDDVYRNIVDLARLQEEFKEPLRYRDEKTVIGAIIRLMESGEHLASIDGVTATVFKPSDLLPYIVEELRDQGVYHEAVFAKTWSPHKIGRILTRMKISRRRREGRPLYIVSGDEVKRLMEMYGVKISPEKAFPGELGELGEVKVKRQPQLENSPSHGEASMEEGCTYMEEGEFQDEESLLHSSSPNSPNSPGKAQIERISRSVSDGGAPSRGDCIHLVKHPNRIYCSLRGDISLDLCRGCVDYAPSLRKPTSKDGLEPLDAMILDLIARRGGDVGVLLIEKTLTDRGYARSEILSSLERLRSLGLVEVSRYTVRLCGSDGGAGV